MTMDSSQVRELNPADRLALEEGEVLEVISGEVLLFAQRQDGRRIELMKLSSGQVAVGCSGTSNGSTLLIVGLPGANVLTTTVGSLRAQGRSGLLEEWVYFLGDAARAGRWAEKIVAPEGSPIRLAPGESVSTHARAIALSDHSIQGWLRVASGSARYCGWEDVDVGVLDSAVPMTRGTWLTSGLRCQIGPASGPETDEEWIHALGAVGALALQAVSAAEKARSEIRVMRLEGAEDRALQQTQAGVARLVGALRRNVATAKGPGENLSSILKAAFEVAAASGLHVTAESRAQVVAEVALGRDPLTATAEACQARARIVDLASGWWKLEGPPLVGTLDSGNTVALHWKGRRWIATDPRGLDEPFAVDASTAGSFAPRATEFVPVLPATPSSLRALSRLTLEGSRSELIVIGVTTSLIAAAAFVIPYVFGRIAESFDSISVRNLLQSLLALGLILAASVGWQLVRGRAVIRARARGGAIAMGAMWDRMMRLPATWHQGKSLGDRLTQATAVNVASSGVSDLMVAQLLDTVVVLGSLAAIATTNMSLLASVTALTVVQLTVNALFVRASAKRAADRVEANAQVSGLLIETIRSANRLKSSGAEARAFHRWAMVHAELTRADLKLRFIMTTQSVLIAAWPLIGLMLVVIVAQTSNATFANFVTAQTAAVVMSVTIAAATMAASSTLASREVIKRIEPILEETPEGFGEGENPGRLFGELAFRKIMFRYASDGPLVLSGVTFGVSPGEHVAIVGGSGSGKSTLLRVLLGLEDVDSGVVEIDGKDLSSLNRPLVRRQIGCVLQSSALLPGTIRENVDMGRHLSNDQIWEALDAAAIGDLIRGMARGLSTPVVEGGTSLSGGERQRVLIARALAGRPRMLILDESTSALDNATQEEIVGSIERLRVTRIVVAHRLSTIQRADRIIVLEGGRVAQEGTFKELMATAGPFRDLAERQLV